MEKTANGKASSDYTLADLKRDIRSSLSGLKRDFAEKVVYNDNVRPHLLLGGGAFVAVIGFLLNASPQVRIDVSFAGTAALMVGWMDEVWTHGA